MYVPKNKPLLRGLNSYYLDFAKLVDFYKAGMLSGCIHLKSHEAEAAVFLGGDTVQGAVYEENGSQMRGEEALQAIADKSSKTSFQIDIYEVPEEIVKFCSNIQNAVPLHTNISTEFIDIRKLLRKLVTDKITGFLELSLDKKKDKRFIFFSSGITIGTSNFENDVEYKNIDDITAILIRELESVKGSLSVKIVPQSDSQSEPAIRPLKPSGAQQNGLSRKSIPAVITPILAEVSKVVSKASGNTEKFDILLKRKFLHKADKYTFLDPFEEEIEYDGTEFRLNANISPVKLIEAMRECLLEIGSEYGVASEVENVLRAGFSSISEDGIRDQPLSR